MKVAVAGGAGAMSWSGEVHLLDQADVDDLLLVDIDDSALRERRARLGDDARVRTKVVDLTDVDAAADAFRGYDVVYNCALMDVNVLCMEACAKAEASYVDLGGWHKLEQLGLHDAFVKAGILGVCGCGTASGASNIMAAYGIERLDQPESVRILDACVDMVPGAEHSRLHWPYAIESIFDEFYDECPYFDGGELRRVPARSFPETYAFREPVGPCVVSTTMHSEPESLGRTFAHLGLQHASWKIGFGPEFEEKMSFLRSVGLMGKEPIDVGGVQVVPRDLMLKLLYAQPPETMEAPQYRGHMAVVVSGTEGGKKVEYTITEYATPALTERMQSKGVRASYRTGTYGAIGVLMIGRGQVARSGVFYPEACMPPAEFLAEAVKAGIDVDVSRREWL